MDGVAVIEEFRSYLREHNLPVTPQRLAVAEVLLLRDRHFSAEEVARVLSPERLSGLVPVTDVINVVPTSPSVP